MQARDVMTNPTIACHANDTLTVAAHRMWEFNIDALAVVNDEGKVTGKITDRDICMAAYTQGKRLDELLVNGAMEHDAAHRP
jgi:predicted transcriptional regulator